MVAEVPSAQVDSARPRRFLLAAQPSVGHTQALRAIGRELLARGHRVVFAISAGRSLPEWLPQPEEVRTVGRVSDAVRDDGFTVLDLPTGPTRLVRGLRIAGRRGSDETLAAVDFFTSGALPDARVLLRAMAGQSADVVVADFTLLGAWLAAERADIDFAAVFHSGLPFPAPELPPAAVVMGESSDTAEANAAAATAMVDERLAVARAKLELAPVAPGLITRPFARGLNVLTTFEQFEPPRPELEESAQGPILWSGPCLGQRSEGAEGFPWDQMGDPSTRSNDWVFISLGTVFNGQPDVYRVLIEGAHRLGLRVVVAAGASLRAARAVADERDIVVRFAPQVELLRWVPVMITHGGNNSMNEALKAGVPMVTVPFGAEQMANARRAELVGVGRTLALADLTPEHVSDALFAQLQPGVRMRAQMVARAVPQVDGALIAADALERLAAGADPLG
ncbi:MAG: hypothetical protein RLZ55_1053 [Actinomycetota bacterium]